LRKNIGSKGTSKMLMKLTPEGDKACITDGMPHSEKNIKKV
jgi:hypothetical protein